MRSHDSYIPATFEERGIAVSFTTPCLSYCRIRKDYRDRLEIVVPNLADGKGSYVIPWIALTQAVTLTTHDRALQEEVEVTNAMSPYDIRTAELNIAREGLAGADVAEAANKALANDARHIDMTTLMFMARVIMSTGTLSPEIIAGIATGESDKIIREAAYAAAESIGIKPNQLEEKLGQLSVVIAPLGIEGAPETGRLRGLIDSLMRCKASLEAWAGKNTADEAELARFSAEVAGLTIDRAKKLIQEFDANLADPIRVLQSWDKESGKLRGAGIRLSWLLDGWELIVRSWEAVETEGRDAQEAALQSIFRALPLLPKSECDEQEANRLNAMRISRRRNVRMYENWQTGEIDHDLLQRIEGAKAKLT